MVHTLSMLFLGFLGLLYFLFLLASFLNGAGRYAHMSSLLLRLYRMYVACIYRCFNPDWLTAHLDHWNEIANGRSGAVSSSRLVEDNRCRFDGVVGYHICLTHRWSPVRAWVESLFCLFPCVTPGRVFSPIQGCDKRGPTVVLESFGDMVHGT